MTSSTAHPVSPSGRPLQFYGHRTDDSSYRDTGPTACPSSHVGWVVASAVLFWPLAIVAFCYSIQVRSRYHAGDRNGALGASNEAEHWGRMGAAIGGTFWALSLVAVLFLAVGSLF
ncbi:CD225/dispanin family protein [Jatrophihabitans fulvus]